MPDSAQPDRLAFHGGLAGALLPFGLFFAGVIWLGLSGAPDERGFWPILVAALTLGLALARDRHRYAETIVAGMSQRIVLLMILAWLLAGALGTLMNASGFVDALVWLAAEAGVSGGGYAAAAFLICCLVSTSTGTSLGTIILCAPLLYPAGGALGTDPVILMAAILGGATFGDNISPVSDTTIASASTQGAQIGDVVRSRLKYALPAAAVALILYSALGGAEAGGGSRSGAAAGSLDAAYATTGSSSQGSETGGAVARGAARGLPMLLVPALVIALLLKKRHLLEGLLFGVAAAVVLGLGLGLLEPAEIFYLDLESFGARGLIVSGLERGIGVSIFTILLMGLVAGVEATGVTDRLVAVARRQARTARGVELWTFATVSAATLLTTHSTVALLAVGNFTREAGERARIPATRRANVLDITVCTYPFLLPYCIPTILAASMTARAGSGMPRLTALEVGLSNFHSWALLAVVLLAIATGWARSSDGGSS